MSVFDFSKMAAVRHLEFVMRVWGHPRRAFGGLYHCAKFGWNRCSIFDNMHVFRFREFGLKTPIHAPKLGVLGGK